MITKVILLRRYKNWILESIVDESAQALGKHPKKVFVPISKRELIYPSSIRGIMSTRRVSNSLLIGYETFHFIKSKSLIEFQTCNLYLTHPNRDMDFTQIQHFRNILVMNQADKRWMLKAGVDENKIHVVHGAIDEEVFWKKKSSQTIKPHFALIVSDCKPRKNPEQILELIAQLPKVNFVIHGKGWLEGYRNIMESLENLRYLEFDFGRQPELMRDATVFLSLSSLEGGPYSLLEAMACGTFVISTSVGFAPDLINSSNGVLLPVDYSLEFVAQVITENMEVVISRNIITSLPFELSWRKLGQALFQH
jgi:glycosyltransferase involved in cell wall biosynthesis